MTRPSIDKSQLPHLLRLLDDDNPSVQEAILDALIAFGDDLYLELASLPDPVDDMTLDRIDTLLWRHRSLSAALASREHAEPRFEAGQVVRHGRYGYRGVVVAVDEFCMADDDWYEAGENRPPKDQPWYHVLVHNSMQVTYAAQSSLVDDDSEEAILHPYVPYFFSRFEDGRYLRNDQPWPGWW